METVLSEAPVAKRKGRPKTSERDDVAVKLDRAIASMAKVIAASKGIPLAQLLTEIVEGPVSRAYAARMRELEGKG